jgi:hypothetical protein
MPSDNTDAMSKITLRHMADPLFLNPLIVLRRDIGDLQADS